MSADSSSREDTATAWAALARGVAGADPDVAEADDQPKAYLEELKGFVAGGVEAQLRPTPA